MEIRSCFRRSANILVFFLATLVFSAQAQNRDEIVFFFNDAQGSAVAAVNESGELCWHENYSPYGEKSIGDDVFSQEGCGIVGEERGFTSHTVDYDTDLVYMQQRYYDPTIGRFLSIDPVGPVVGDPRTFNRYAYANNNPYRYVDPDGRAAETPWDVFNLGLGAHSMRGNIAEGNYGWATVDALGMLFDGIATTVPFLPGGAGATIKAARSADAVIASGRTGDTVGSQAQKEIQEAATEPNRIYSAHELKRRAKYPRKNNTPDPNHNFPETFNDEIFKGNKTIVSDNYHLYTKPGTLNGNSGTFEIGVRPSASGRTEVITHRFFKPNK